MRKKNAENMKEWINIPLKVSVHQWKGEDSFQGQETDAILENLSESGLRIRTKESFSKDMLLKIMFPNHEILTPILGRVVRCDSMDGEYYYDCMVTGVSLADFRKLERYIRHRKSKRKK